MAGIKRLDKTPQNLNFIVNELITPEIHHKFFDDNMGYGEIAGMLYSPFTEVYGIFEKGLPLPIGVVFFTNVTPYRDSTLYACVFREENRRKGKIKEVIPKIKQDFTNRYFPNSVSSFVIGKNPASEHLLKSNGFWKVGTKPNHVYSNGEFRDLQMWLWMGDIEGLDAPEVETQED